MIDLQDLIFTYPDATRPALLGVSLHVPAGGFCLVMGSSGSGKSTLLRCINGLVPHFSGGNLSGRIMVNDLDPVRQSPQEMSRVVGFVFQDPEAQFVVDRVEDEVAFSLENASIPAAEMDIRIRDVLDLLELTPLRRRKLDTLSGGERQRLAIAAALALKPPILVLDEPTSQLDPHAADEVLQSVTRLNKQHGLTIMLAEHRLERVLPYIDQVLYLSAENPGGISGDPRDVMGQIPLHPPIITLGKAFGWNPLPLTVTEAQECALLMPEQHTGQAHKAGFDQTEGKFDAKPVFIEAKGIHVDIGNQHILNDVDIKLRQGEITVMVGPNGAGKTTLLRALVGLIPIQKGSIQVDGRAISGKSVADICQQVGYLPQDPNALLFADTVLEELLITLRNHQVDLTKSVIKPESLLDQLGLADKVGAYPRDLSTGERQRVALGAVMVTHPGALLLDEPTRGLDYPAKQALHGLLHGWRNDGMAILLVTHDVELAAQVADRIVLLENGKITSQGSPWAVLSKFPAFSTQVAKIFPGRGWLTVDDAFGGMHASEH